MIEISLAESIAGINPSEWDEIADGSVLASHACQRLTEETSAAGPQCRYFLARENSKLQAALAWWVERSDGRIRMLEETLFGSLQRVPRLFGVRTLPAMNCGGLLCWHSNVFFRPGLPEAERTRLFEALLAQMEHEAERAGCVICFRNIPRTARGLSDVFVSRGYLRSPELPVCYLDIEWDSFDGYLRGLKKHHQWTSKNIRAELNSGRRAGVIISQVENPAPIYDQLHRLMDAHNRRLNGRPFPYRPEFFQKLKAYLDGRAIVYTATLQERIIAALVMFCEKGVTFVPMVGIDDEFVRKHSLYFNLVFNRPIEDAIKTGTSRLYFGRKVYGAKLRRGCRLAGGDLFVRGKNGLGRGVLHFLLAARNWRMNRLIARAGALELGTASRKHHSSRP